MKKKIKYIGTAQVVSRVIVGILWIYASIPKVLDSHNAGFILTKYKLFPYYIAYNIGQYTGFIELLLGIIIILGIYKRIFLSVGILLMITYISAIISLWIRGIYINCGCFSNVDKTYNNASEANYLLDILRDIGILLLHFIPIIDKDKILNLFNRNKINNITK